MALENKEATGGPRDANCEIENNFKASNNVENNVLGKKIFKNNDKMENIF